MNRRVVILGLGSSFAAWPSFSCAQAPESQVLTWGAWRDIPAIAILSAEDDSRVPAVSDAVDFWNAAFAQLGSPFRLGAIVHSLRIVAAGDLRALKATPRIVAPSLLNGIREANGNVIIALSEEAGFNPFTFPLPALRKVLVAIPTLREKPLTLPWVARNIIAHELGHVIGLGHNDDAAALMCGGPWCDFGPVGDRFAALTAAEKAKLLEMYPPNWQSVPSRRWKADPPAGTAG
jgi:hypothetical protein